MRPLVCRLTGVVAIAIAMNAAAQNAPVTDLGAGVFPAAINRSGTIVGLVRTPATAIGFAPFVWQNGTLTVVDTTGWIGGRLTAVNTAGVAVGQAALTTEEGDPLIYSNGTATLLGLGGGFASSINDNGVIGGAVEAGGFVDANGTTSILTELGEVNALDSAGDAAGYTVDSSSNAVAAVWTAPLYTLQVLPGLGGQQAIAFAMNDHGTIAGWATLPSSPADFHAVMWQNGAMTDLGEVPGADVTLALALNNSGEIVGEGTTGANHTAFVYRSGAMQTLDDVGATSGWHFEQARGINDAGQIVGYGTPPNATEPHGFVLQLPQTPAQIIASTIATIQGFGLNGGIAQSLVAKLQAIAAELGQPTACSDLAAFVNEVKAQSGKHLTTAEADQLLADAAALGAAMGC